MAEFDALTYVFVSPHKKFPGKPKADLPGTIGAPAGEHTLA